MKKISLFIILIFFTAAPVFAVTYTVKTGGGDYTTIQACANAAQAGDSCEVYDGTYTGSVTPPRDGSSGSWITFQAADGNSPTMTGGWNLSSRDYIVIDGFTIGGGTTGTNVTNVKILNNTIDGVSVGIRLDAGYDILIKGNTFNNMSNDAIRQFGDRWAIINNTMTNETDSGDVHMDFWQSWCAPVGVAAAYILIENNLFANISGGNVHFSLNNGTSSCNDPTTNKIVRYNKMYYTGSIASYVDNNSAASGSGENVIYNNTFHSLCGGEGACSSWQTYAHSYAASDDSFGINNIFYNAMIASNANGFDWGSNASQSYNLYYDPDGTMTFSGLASNETGAVKNQDPLIVDIANYNFSLQASSPAINAGGSLTNVATADTGTGTSLVVDEAYFFQPGWGGADADTIAVASVSNTVQIASINYSTNTITLVSSISRNDGDSIWLYKDSDGSLVLYGSAPDIGAVEFISDIDATRRPKPPILHNN